MAKKTKAESAEDRARRKESEEEQAESERSQGGAVSESPATESRLKFITWADAVWQNGRIRLHCLPDEQKRIHRAVIHYLENGEHAETTMWKAAFEERQDQILAEYEDAYLEPPVYYDDDDMDEEAEERMEREHERAEAEDAFWNKEDGFLPLDVPWPTPYGSPTDFPHEMWLIGHPDGEWTGAVHKIVIEEGKTETNSDKPSEDADFPRQTAPIRR